MAEGAPPGWVKRVVAENEAASRRDLLGWTSGLNLVFESKRDCATWFAEGYRALQDGGRRPRHMQIAVAPVMRHYLAEDPVLVRAQKGGAGSLELVTFAPQPH